ncbi:SPOR domain-containing protein [Mariprofundus sp. EBB-1]|uniref:SPOR domain-containing protein n=1 Tax=Mariprofundus sp. EBB-1 TaxID=2650971 RepID=UPI000EF1EA7A|nr:SPOR domain-containing protein [Mariprofundus sp. EBB-1]RLL53679.1 SPOR domain-containing protein [Mariprofundus sp. EBB-1]
MDKKDNNEPITEEDYDLFYGFVDSVFEEKKQFEGDNQKTSAALTNSEWVSEPFEEFIVGMPQQDGGKYYSLNIISPDLDPSPVSEIHPNHYGTISGMIISTTICIAVVFSLYFFTTPDRTPTEDMAKLHNIENKLNAIESNMAAAERIDIQIQAMTSKLNKLNTLIASSQQQRSAAPVQAAPKVSMPSATIPKAVVSAPAIQKVAASAPVTRKKAVSAAIIPKGVDTIAAAPKTAVKVSHSLDSTFPGWVINLASVRGTEGVDQLLSRVKGLGIPAEPFTTYIEGKEWTRIRVTGFSNKAIALQAMQELPKLNVFSHSWVGPL